jgi:hypothetical protein
MTVALTVPLPDSAWRADLDPAVAGPAALRLGVTGHVRLTRGSRALVGAALRAALRQYDGRPVHGITCLADGADQLFAQALIETDGTYEAVLPAADYREREVAPANRATFDRLLRRAVRVTYAFPVTCAKAYAAAGARVLDGSDRLLAVWDGGGGGLGGTAEVVAGARRRGMPVEVVWPAGARRR